MKRQREKASVLNPGWAGLRNPWHAFFSPAFVSATTVALRVEVLDQMFSAVHRGEQLTATVRLFLLQEHKKHPEQKHCPGGRRMDVFPRLLLPLVFRNPEKI